MLIASESFSRLSLVEVTLTNLTKQTLQRLHVNIPIIGIALMKRKNSYSFFRSIYTGRLTLSLCAVERLNIGDRGLSIKNVFFSLVPQQTILMDGHLTKIAKK